MDKERFDALIRTLGHGATRRGALGLLAGVAGLGLENVAARGKRRKRQAREQTAGVGKVTLCHHDQDTDTWHPITVSNNALPAHQRHGDFAYDVAAGQCCTDADCNGDPCEITITGGTGSGQCQTPYYPGTCEVGQNYCQDFTSFCDNTFSCGCFSTLSGGTICGNGACSDCASDADCAAGEACIDATGCCDSGRACVYACNTATTSSRSHGRQPLVKR